MKGSNDLAIQVSGLLKNTRGNLDPALDDLHTALDALSSVLPNANRTIFSGLGHSGPDDNGDPARVAEALREFYA